MIEIIPAIDIIDGKCVRLVQGDFLQKKSYSGSPLEVAKRFEGAGVKRLHLVDLDGARQKQIVNHKVLESIASGTNLWIDFGGGIQSHTDLQLAFDSGAKQVTGGSVAIKHRPEFEKWLQQYGSEKIILGADVKEDKIAVHGWQETTSVSIENFIDSYLPFEIEYVICTDVAKDGLLQGPSFDLYAKLRDRFPALKFIASGGITTIEDIKKLDAMGMYGAIIGKAYYEGHLHLSDFANFLNTPH